MKLDLSIIRKLVFQLKPAETFNYLVYQTQLKFGIFQFTTPAKRKPSDLGNQAFSPNWLPFWSQDSFIRNDILDQSGITRRADEIQTGKIKLFGSIDKKVEKKLQTSPCLVY